MLALSSTERRDLQDARTCDLRAAPTLPSKTPTRSQLLLNSGALQLPTVCTLMDALLTIMVGIVAEETTIDGAGRIVIPKPLRDRMNLTPGARLHIFEEAGCLIISPNRREPRLVERDGFLALDLGTEVSVNTDSAAAREERIRQLVEYALRR
jgi:AbrB family looped-hinge helix DNA binding protein